MQLFKVYITVKIGKPKGALIITKLENFLILLLFHFPMFDIIYVIYFYLSNYYDVDIQTYLQYKLTFNNVLSREL